MTDDPRASGSSSRSCASPIRSARTRTRCSACSRSGASVSKSESRELALPTTAHIDIVTEQLEQETADLADRSKALAELNEVVHSLQARHRATSDAWQVASSALADHEARAQALSDLQAKIGTGKDAAAWISARGLEHARRLWQQLDIERGWEDALEAVLRERLNALELSSLDAVLEWIGDGYCTPGTDRGLRDGRAERASEPRGDTLLAKVRARQPQLTRLLADWLHGVHCRDDLAAALRDRTSLMSGESFVVPSGHVVNAHGVNFFAPDSELHGVLARQRELARAGAGDRRRAHRNRGRRDCAFGCRGRTQAAPAGISRRKHGTVVAAAPLSRTRARVAAVEAGRRDGRTATGADRRGGRDVLAHEEDHRTRGAGRRRCDLRTGRERLGAEIAQPRQRAKCGQRGGSGARPRPRAGAGGGASDAGGRIRGTIEPGSIGGARASARIAGGAACAAAGIADTRRGRTRRHRLDTGRGCVTRHS